MILLLEFDTQQQIPGLLTQISIKHVSQEDEECNREKYRRRDKKGVASSVEDW